MRAQSTSLPPKIKSQPSLMWFAVVVLGATALAASAVIFFFNPSTHGFYPICLFHALTGWNCPSCGGTRAVYALLHGDWSLALKDNAFFAFLFAALVVRGARFVTKKILRRPVGQFLPTKLLLPLLSVALIFSVLRNLPAFSFLAP